MTLVVLSPRVLAFSTSEELGGRFICTSGLEHPVVCFSITTSAAVCLAGRHLLNFFFYDRDFPGFLGFFLKVVLFLLFFSDFLCITAAALEQSFFWQQKTAAFWAKFHIIT